MTTKNPLPRLQPSTLRAIRKRITEWFASSQRDLPWRQDGDPYRVLVSEIMLQQTRVETVIPYFKRFMERFPSFEALAEAPEEEVLRHWAGLGYYRRAKSLHQTAKVVADSCDGRFPDNREEALTLPGIGPYTAGAVLSIAYGKPEPLVDGNVERVLSRLFAFQENLATAQGKKGIWEIAASLVKTEDPGAFNQGLMELGALICVPSAPRCLLCPLSEICQGYQRGIADRLPFKTKEKRSFKVKEAVLLLKNRGKWLITDTNEESLLPGLWQFPWAWKKRGERFPQETLARLSNWLGIAELPVAEFHQLKHGITFRSISTIFYLAELKDRKVTIDPEGPGRFRWVSAEDLVEEALPAYQKKVVGLLGGEG